MQTHGKKLNRKRALVLVILVICFGVLAFASWFIYAIITDEPPQFFPLDNPHGEYKITKACPVGQGWQHTKTGDPEGLKGYCVEYKGEGVFMNSDYGTNFFRITVGNSQVDLAPFEGKQVKNIKGKYRSSSKQCIKDECIDIGGPYVVLHIETLELAD